MKYLGSINGIITLMICAIGAASTGSIPEARPFVAALIVLTAITFDRVFEDKS